VPHCAAFSFPVPEAELDDRRKKRCEGVAQVICPPDDFYTTGGDDPIGYRPAKF
jgi:hypothetical protein